MARNASANRATKTNWYVDLLLTLVVVVVSAPSFTGVSIHEWLGLAFGGTVIVHLLLHWQWIATTVARFFGQINALARINFVVNSLLLVALTMAVLSGLLTSQTVSQVIGFSTSTNHAWRGIHSGSTSALLVLTGLHLALNWKWVLHTTGQLFGRRERPAP